MKQESNSDILLKRIRGYHKKEKCSLLSLSEKSGLHRNTLRRLYDPKWNPSSKTLDAVIKFLDTL